MPTLDHWVIPRRDKPIKVDIELRNNGLGWFRLFRTTASGQMELIDGGPSTNVGLDKYTFTVSPQQLTAWVGNGRRLFLELRGLGAKAQEAPLVMSVSQNDAIVEARDADRKTINSDGDGGFVGLEIAKVTSLKSTVIPFDLLLPKVSP